MYSLNVKTVLFQTIQYRINTQFSSIWPIERTLSGATTPSQSELGSDDNKGVLHIHQNSRITGASPSDCLESYPGYLLRESYLSAEMQSVNSLAPADWEKKVWISLSPNGWLNSISAVLLQEWLWH